jgi:hypothetical protein
MQSVKVAILVLAAFSIVSACKSADVSQPQENLVAAAPAPPAAPKTPLEEAGIPLYPGSKKVSMSVSKPAANGSKRVAAEYSSADSPDKVSAFYQQKLGLMQGGMGKMVQLVGKLPNRMFTQILIGPKDAGARIQYYAILAPKS